VSPKYRNPENPSETLAGRGLTPRWVAAALKGGKKLEYFSIAQTAKQVTEKASREVRRAKDGNGFSDSQSSKRTTSQSETSLYGGLGKPL